MPASAPSGFLADNNDVEVDITDSRTTRFHFDPYASVPAPAKPDATAGRWGAAQARPRHGHAAAEWPQARVLVVGGADVTLQTPHIERIRENSPLAEDGRITVGDRIVSVNGVSTDYMAHTALINAIKRCAKQSVFSITVEKVGETRFRQLLAAAGVALAPHAMAQAPRARAAAEAEARAAAEQALPRPRPGRREQAAAQVAAERPPPRPRPGPPPSRPPPPRPPPR